MKAIEGKLGRVFLIHLEGDEKAAEALQRFAREKGIIAAQVSVAANCALAGIIIPGDEDAPEVRLPNPDDMAWSQGDIVVQELLGINFRRVKDPSSGREILTRVASTKTRVMEKPAPSPAEEGPGTIPVYLFNAEFN